VRRAVVTERPREQTFAFFSELGAAPPAHAAARLLIAPAAWRIKGLTFTAPLSGISLIYGLLAGVMTTLMNAGSVGEQE
jgi:hypothetical protein